jgi:hypothetical protein
MGNFMNLRYLFFLLLILIFSGPVYADVFVYDTVALSREEILIKADTKKGYFAKGGQLVEFSVNGKSIGSVLPGGDGVAYKIFKTGGAGLYTVTAKLGKDTGSGYIMVLKKDSAIVFVDVEGSLLAAPFAIKPVESSREAIKKIMDKYPVVYIHFGDIGIKEVREWLIRNKFPASALLAWKTGDVFAELDKKGFRIKAVIGSQVVLDSAVTYGPMAFSFDEQNSSNHLRMWREIEKKLR